MTQESPNRYTKLLQKNFQAKIHTLITDSFFESSNESNAKLDMIIRILKTNFRQRSDRDLEHLVPLVKTIQFFIERDIKDQDCTEIVSCLTHEQTSSEDTVFDYGSYGDKFYIILQGAVKVLVPHPEVRDVQSLIEHSKQTVQEKMRQLKQLEFQIQAKKLSMGDPLLMQKMTSNFAQSPKKTNRSQVKGKDSAESSEEEGVMNQLFALVKKKQKLELKAKERQEQRKQNRLLEQMQLGLMMQMFKQQQSSPTKSLIRQSLEAEGEGNSFITSLNKLRKQGSKKNDEPEPNTLEYQRDLLAQEIEHIKVHAESTYYLETITLRSGKSFGELALIRNQPRAATIKCVENCHFAVMSKNDYQKVLQRIEQKNMQRIVQFLHQIPFLKQWTRNGLAKLQYSFEQRSFQRGQVAIKEQDQANNVFIIKSGEFEVSKKLLMKEEDPSLHHLLGTSDSKDDNQSRLKSVSKQLSNKQPRVYKIALLGMGQLFGEEDVMIQRAYTTTITCKSNHAEIYCIKSDEFFRKFKHNQESWRVLTLMAMMKERVITQKVNRLQRMIQESKGLTTQQINSISKDNMLLNQNEYDLRETFKEIIGEYPYVQQQKKLVQDDSKAETKDKVNQKRTMEISLSNIKQDKAAQKEQEAMKESLIMLNVKSRSCSPERSMRPYMSSKITERIVSIKHESQYKDRMKQLHTQSIGDCNYNDSIILESTQLESQSPHLNKISTLDLRSTRYSQADRQRYNSTFHLNDSYYSTQNQSLLNNSALQHATQYKTSSATSQVKASIQSNLPLSATLKTQYRPKSILQPYNDSIILAEPLQLQQRATRNKYASRKSTERKIGVACTMNPSRHNKDHTLLLTQKRNISIQDYESSQGKLPTIRDFNATHHSKFSVDMDSKYVARSANFKQQTNYQ